MSTGTHEASRLLLALLACTLPGRALSFCLPYMLYYLLLIVAVV